MVLGTPTSPDLRVVLAMTIAINDARVQRRGPVYRQKQLKQH